MKKSQKSDLRFHETRACDQCRPVSNTFTPRVALDLLKSKISDTTLWRPPLKSEAERLIRQVFNKAYLLSFVVYISDFEKISSSSEKLFIQINLCKHVIKLFLYVVVDLCDWLYNPDHDILELYNVLVQIWVATSKMKLDI